MDSGLSPHLPRDTQFPDYHRPWIVGWSGRWAESTPRDRRFPDCHGHGAVGWSGQFFLSDFPINICHLIFLFCLLEGLDGIDAKAEMFLEYNSRAPQPLKTSAQG